MQSKQLSASGKVSEVNGNYRKDDEDEVHLEDDEQHPIVWGNVIAFIIMHLCVPYSFYQMLAVMNAYDCFAYNMFVGYMSGLGVTAGAHRLWAHRAYKAKLPLRIFLAFWFIIAGQNDLYEWCRDHRVHHKYSETNADPHNSNRGFFFAHMGWLCCRKHSSVIKKGRTLDLSDLLEDPVVRFQRKYYLPLVLLLSFVLPTWIMMKLFPYVSIWKAIAFTLTRYTTSLHITWLVNSVAHIWGSRPYNTDINPRESPFVILVNFLGEGYHNYHHTFPWDYKASEYGWFTQFNVTAAFIDLMAWLGLAYDLRSPSNSMVEKHKQKVIQEEPRATMSYSDKNMDTPIDYKVQSYKVE